MIEYFHWDSVFAMVSMEIYIDICIEQKTEKINQTKTMIVFPALTDFKARNMICGS